MREVRWDGHTLWVRAFGRFTGRALIDATGAITADSRYDALQFLVVDFLAAEASESGLAKVVDDLLAILIGASFSNPNIRICVIARDQCILRLFESVIQQQSALLPEIRAFDDLTSATDWISEQPRLSRPSGRFRTS